MMRRQLLELFICASLFVSVLSYPNRTEYKGYYAASANFSDGDTKILGQVPIPVSSANRTVGGKDVLYSAFQYNSAFAKDFSHECIRDCTNAQPKTCHYTLVIQWYVTNGLACVACPFNITDCQRPQCMTFDGTMRPVITVNKALPGQSIHVCEGDRVEIDVENDLVSDTTTIHWHGLHQTGTPHYDGVPLLTQCPILPYNYFMYNFTAYPVGTHFYHSHSGVQRSDGLFGSFMVRSKNDPHRALYDYDKPEHQILIMDVADKLFMEKMLRRFDGGEDSNAHTLLINGMGMYQMRERNCSTNATVTCRQKAHMPLAEFWVTKGKRHRFRMISNGIQTCPILVSIDGHKMKIIASDGMDLEAFDVESFTIYAGERIDFVLEANQEASVYWMKFQGLLECKDGDKFTAHQVAILRYEGVKGFQDLAPQDIDYNATGRDGYTYNSVNVGPGDGSYITVDQITGLQEVDYSGKPDHNVNITFDFRWRDYGKMPTETPYPYFGVVHQIDSARVNGSDFKMPNAPPLTQNDDFNTSYLCTEEDNLDKCQDDFCYCTNVVAVKLNSLVEVILVDPGVVYSNHPFHLHGHSFAVVSTGKLPKPNTTLEEVLEMDKNGSITRNFTKPALKDTVTIPSAGYTIIRFYANNPGYWLLHCHLDIHAELGMILAFQVGEVSDFPSTPAGFPKCNNWKGH